MFHRSLPDVAPTVDADLDTAEMAAGEAAAARAEHRLRVLGELTDISLNLARSHGAVAQARAEAAVTENRGLAPDDERAVAAYNKVAQTVRRTVALHERADTHATTRRQNLTAEGARRRADREADHATAKTDAIIEGLHDAYAADCPEAEYRDMIDRMMEDAQEHLEDTDEFRGWLDRPVGESVARLCAILGLDPAACVLDGETWTVRRAPSGFELRVAERAEKYPSPPLPPLDGEGGSERGDETGGERRSDPDPTVICRSSITGADPPTSPPFIDGSPP